jgi:hypothetical protein
LPGAELGACVRLRAAFFCDVTSFHDEGAGTKVVFDHDGFPADMKEHLAKGWQANYWDKLALA